MNSLDQSRVFGSVYQEDPLLFTEKVFLSQTEMATTVGDTLASSKLAVAQDDLHLAGSSVDQLTVQFNQLAFDEFLASDRNGLNKRRRSEDRQPTTGGVTPPSSTGSAPSLDHGP